MTTQALRTDAVRRRTASTAVRAPRSHKLTLGILLAPACAGLAIFQLGPLVYALLNSLRQVSLLDLTRSKYVGLANYAELLQDMTFWHSMGNTLLYVVGKLAVQVPLAFALAVLLDRKLRGTALARAALFAPLVTSGAVIAVIWNLMYFPDTGLFNAIIDWSGLPTQPFLTSSAQALPAILLVGIWEDIGFSVLIFLAGLQAVPASVYEAAELDGVRGFRLARFVTLPLLRRTTMVVTFMATVFSFRVFTPIFVMTQGGPDNATNNAVYFMYQQAFQFSNLGYASAVGVTVIILVAGLLAIQARLLRTDLEY
ncbi:carbohydrate ABC transporter permease [Kribbella shirazensis]|uniref:ABC-type sugar transport system permease subunit n=1 Tax=Kribbella shirazensis TaxID=1105143 RepID=A0A7X5VCF4_9ACTN|nr:sugar ABC transporter permease [Kribbella shirazensis]NIK58603.1 ABC-type sugar transport system permease subunit [Kribbella shirazensis]